MPIPTIPARPVKIRITRKLEDVFEKYQPVIGAVYDALYRQSNKRYADFCVITVGDKPIVVRDKKFEIVEDLVDG